MKALSAQCSESQLVPSEGSGYALAVTITSTGDEPVAISGVFLCRKGINAFPEFAEAFGLDQSKVISGLEPEAYQVRVEMLLSHKGQLLYGDGESEFHLLPGKSVRFTLPLPFNGTGCFLGGDADDVFVATKSVTENGHTLMVSGLQETIHRSIQDHGHLGSPYNINLSLKVPMTEPPSKVELDRVVGTTNPKPVRPMPNT